MPTRYQEITADLVRNLDAAPAGDLFIRDTVTPGFGIRIKPTGVASYIAEYRVSGGRTRRVTIAKVSAVDVQTARKEAKGYLADAALGKDRVADKKVVRTAQAEAAKITLAVVFDEYFEDRKHSDKPLKPRTLQDYKRLLQAKGESGPRGRPLEKDGALYCWKDTPIADITRDMVKAHHRKLIEDVGAAQANMAMRVLRAVLNHSRANHSQRKPGHTKPVPLIEDNPVAILREAKTWAKVKPRKGHIGARQLPAWWAGVQKLAPTMRDFLVTLLLTGRRRGELEPLTWDAVSLPDKKIVFRDTKNNTDVEIPTGRYLHKLLTARHEARDEECPWVFRARVGNGHLVEPIIALRQLGKDTGVDVAPHDIRRSFARFADGLPGVSNYVLKALMGNKVRDITGAYVQVSVDKARKPMQTIEDYILKTAKALPPKKRAKKAAAKRPQLRVVSQ